MGCILGLLVGPNLDRIAPGVARALIVAFLYGWENPDPSTQFLAQMLTLLALVSVWGMCEAEWPR